MSFYIGLIFWIVLAAALIAAVVLAATIGTVNSLIPLAIGMIIFTAGFIKFGCLSH